MSQENLLLHGPFARKPKRIRTAFSPSQLLRLERAFEKNHYVVGAERKQLAGSLSLSETQVGRGARRKGALGRLRFACKAAPTRSRGGGQTERGRPFCLPRERSCEGTTAGCSRMALCHPPWHKGCPGPPSHKIVQPPFFLLLLFLFYATFSHSCLLAGS